MQVQHPRIDFDRERLTAFCEKWKITEFQFVGSVVREDFRPDSDVDVMVLFAPDSPFKIWDFGKAEDELREIFGRKTDLIDRKAVEQSKNYIRKRLLLNGDRRYTKDQARLCDVLQLLERLPRYLCDKTPEQLQDDDLLLCATQQEILWIERMTRRVSGEFKASTPQINWHYLEELSYLVGDGVRMTAQGIWNFTMREAEEFVNLIKPFVPPEN